MRVRKAIRFGTVAAATTAGITAAVGIGAGIAGWQLYRRMRPGADLSGKVVLITGSSRGLGLAMAEEFARKGARLVICARDQGELDCARLRLTALGNPHHQLPSVAQSRNRKERPSQPAKPFSI